MFQGLDEFLRYTRVPVMTASILGNLVVVIVLLRYKVLRRNSSHMLIAQLAFADFILGVGLLIRAIQTEIYIATNIVVFDRDSCMLYGATTILGMTLLQVTIIMITLDRLSVLIFPIFYRNHVDSVRVSITRFIITLFISLISFAGQFIQYPFNGRIKICSSGAAWSEGYRFYFMIFSASSSIATIVLNSLTVVVYWRQTHLSARRKENSVLIAQTAIMISYIIFWCIPAILYLVATILGYQAVIFGNITLILSIGSGFFASLNPFLFLWKHSEFRTLFVRFYHLQPIFKSASVTANMNFKTDLPHSRVSTVAVVPTTGK